MFLVIVVGSGVFFASILVGYVFVAMMKNLVCIQRQMRETVNKLSRIDEKIHQFSDNAQSLSDRLGVATAKLNRVVPDELQRYVQECTKLRAQQLTAETTLKKQRAERRADQLEAWVAALASGRESMQAQAIEGFPLDMSADTRGRLASHLERHQIKLAGSVAAGGSEGGNGGASEPPRSRGQGSQR